jgi:methylated-DNA-[protein]-cysteine S-methyltransferase|tara:strand:- start:3126 stop:3638 length:513 start_codon:yes stop_codon:yes gene_type:complete
MSADYYAIFKTSLGWCGIIYGKHGLIKIYLPGMKKEKLEKSIHSYNKSIVGRSGRITILIRNICSYFKGKNVRFNLPVNMGAMTDFEKKVYKQAMKIPFGKVKTYKWLAEKAGVPNGARAVGNALGKNPVPLIIPCHRVIKSDGRLGGFSTPGGILIKRKMLSIEGHANW